MYIMKRYTALEQKCDLKIQKDLTGSATKQSAHTVPAPAWTMRHPAASPAGLLGCCTEWEVERVWSWALETKLHMKTRKKNESRPHVPRRRYSERVVGWKSSPNINYHIYFNQWKWESTIITLNSFLGFAPISNMVPEHAHAHGSWPVPFVPRFARRMCVNAHIFVLKKMRRMRYWLVSTHIQQRHQGVVRQRTMVSALVRKGLN